MERTPPNTPGIKVKPFSGALEIRHFPGRGLATGAKRCAGAGRIGGAGARCCQRRLESNGQRPPETSIVVPVM
jgi:hypothetical protein